MKITITQDFDKVEDAQAFLEKVVGSAPAVAQAQEAQRTDDPAPTTAIPTQAQSTQLVADAPKTDTTEKPKRKPRSDAGLPRGPHKTTREPAASEPGPAADSVAAQPAAPATPPTTVEERNAAARASVAPTSAPAAEKGAVLADTSPERKGPDAPAAAEPTYEEAHAALKRINATAGMGMEACIAHIQTFGTNSLKLLDKKHYAEFIKQADAKIAAFLKAKK